MYWFGACVLLLQRVANIESDSVFQLLRGRKRAIVIRQTRVLHEEARRHCVSKPECVETGGASYWGLRNNALHV